MISWKEFSQLNPDWATAAERLRLQPGSTPDQDGIGFIATVARDGRPRMAPVCPIFTMGNLWLSVSRRTVKAHDLQNDGRYTIHAFLGENDEEFQISGSARIVENDKKKADVQNAISFQYDPADLIFELNLARAVWAYWINPGQPGTRVVKQTWQS